MDLTQIEPIIEDIVKKSLDARVYQYGKNGSLTNRVATGTLRNSVKAKTTTNKQGNTIIEITYLGGKKLTDTGNYAYWLVYGRKAGKWANIGAIEEWIRNKKSFRIKDFKTGRFLPKTDKNIKSVAYVIARSIGKFGFKSKPENFIEVSIDMLMKDERIIQLLGDQTIEDLLNAIEGI
jgi:hypothetical protein